MHKYFDINAPGHSIKCKLYCNSVRDAASIVVCPHGFGGHKDNKATERFAEKLLSKHPKTLILSFDWPAHGDDVKKKLSLADCDLYIDLLLDYISREYKMEDISLYANSFGAYVVLCYINSHGCPFRRMVLRSPAINMYDSFFHTVMSPENREDLERGRDIMVGFDRKVRVDRDFVDTIKRDDVREYEYLDYADQTIIIHGTRDEIIDPDAVRSFSENNVMECFFIEGGDHRFQNRLHLDEAIKYTIDYIR